MSLRIVETPDVAVDGKRRAVRSSGSDWSFRNRGMSGGACGIADAVEWSQLSWEEGAAGKRALSRVSISVRY